MPVFRLRPIDHRVRGDGAPVVLTAVIEKAFGLTTPSSVKKKGININWDAIR